MRPVTGCSVSEHGGVWERIPGIFRYCEFARNTAYNTDSSYRPCRSLSFSAAEFFIVVTVHRRFM